MPNTSKKYSLRILDYLYSFYDEKKPMPSQKEIAAYFGIYDRTVGRNFKRLANQGLIKVYFGRVTHIKVNKKFKATKQAKISYAPGKPLDCDMVYQYLRLNYKIGFPSRYKMSEALGMNERSLYTVLQRLKTQGLISLDKNGNIGLIEISATKGTSVSDQENVSDGSNNKQRSIGHGEETVSYDEGTNVSETLSAVNPVYCPMPSPLTFAFFVKQLKTKLQMPLEDNSLSYLSNKTYTQVLLKLNGIKPGVVETKAQQYKTEIINLICQQGISCTQQDNFVGLLGQFIQELQIWEFYEFHKNSLKPLVFDILLRTEEQADIIGDQQRFHGFGLGLYRRARPISQPMVTNTPVNTNSFKIHEKF